MFLVGTQLIENILVLELRNDFLKSSRTAILRKGQTLQVPDVFRYCPAVTDAVQRGYITICLETEDEASIADVVNTDEIFSNMNIVDPVRGDDCIAQRGSLRAPFKTIQAALDAAVSGDVVYLLPGNHDLTTGIIMPDGVNIRGASLENTKIRWLNIPASGSPVVMIEMGNSNRIEDVYIHMQSNVHTDMVGIHFGGTTDASSKLRTMVMLIDNSTAGAGTSVVYGICSHGTGSPPITFSNVRSVTVTVKSTGNGRKRGTNAWSGAFHLRDVNVNMVGGTDSMCLETNHASAYVSWGVGYLNADSGISMSQTLGTIDVLSTVILGSANGKSFNARANAATHTFSDPKTLPSGTNFMRPGSDDSTASEAKIRIPAHCIMKSLIVRARIAPGADKTDTFTVRKNGIDTALTVSLSGAAVSAMDSTNSVEFMAGDDLSIKVVKQAGSATEDAILNLEEY